MAPRVLVDVQRVAVSSVHNNAIAKCVNSETNAKRDVRGACQV